MPPDTVDFATAPFPITPRLVSVAVAYRNRAYIADLVLHRVNVSAQEFKYQVFPIEETFFRPDTKVGRRSRPNEIDLTATETPSKTEDYGLDDPIPQADIDNAASQEGMRNPLDVGTEQITDYMLIDREKRVADLVFAAASFPAGNKVTLSGTSQWSDFPNSDPIGDIFTALDAPLMRPNIAVFGNDTWTKLRQHPDIIKAVNANSGDKGAAARSSVAELFELDEIHVGRSRLNTAKKGQTATLTRMWGKHAAFLFQDRNADTRNGVTFGLTAQWGARVAGSRRDPDIGLRGGERLRVGESVKELIIASQAGYFVEDAIA